MFCLRSWLIGIADNGDRAARLGLTVGCAAVGTLMQGRGLGGKLLEGDDVVKSGLNGSRAAQDVGVMVLECVHRRGVVDELVKPSQHELCLDDEPRGGRTQFQLRALTWFAVAAAAHTWTLAQARSAITAAAPAIPSGKPTRPG